MTKRIARAFIDKLLDRADIVSTIHQRVPLKKAGKDYQACCPFHQEKTPSFTVSSQKSFYYCFGCGAKGNAIGFLMEYEHLSFVDAVEKLAEESGMAVEYDENFDEEKAQRRRDFYDVLSDTAQLYAQQLFATVGEQAKNYLVERQLDVETTRFFGLGYAQAGNRLQQHFSATYSDTELHKVGLLGHSDDGRFYDQFRDRLMFPIRDPRGRVLGFGARALGDAKPKYLNSSETEVFSKRYVLYGLYEELQSRRNIEHLIIVEGYMDVIALHQMGVAGAVAALGTSLTAEHLELVRRHTKKIFICFDGDNAGKKAAKRAVDTILPAMTIDMDIRVVFLPDGEDPDTLVRKIGKDAFYNLLTQGQPLSEFVYDDLVAGVDLQFVEGRGEAVVRAKKLFDGMPGGDYKSILYQGFVDKTDMDVYQLAKSFQPQSEKPVQKHHQHKRAFALPQGSIETRLIQLLLVCPDFACYVRHHELLYDGDNNDRHLLYDLLNFYHVLFIGAESLPKLDQAFGREALMRLNEIKNSQELIEKVSFDETVEEARLRWKEEFLTGMQSLLNNLQRKIHLQ